MHDQKGIKRRLEMKYMLKGALNHFHTLSAFVRMINELIIKKDSAMQIEQKI